MPRLTSLQTRDRDTIETVEAFQDRRGYATGSEALEKLVQRAKDYGLHISDTPLMPAKVPVVGMVHEDGTVTGNPSSS